MDEHVPSAITDGLRGRGIEVHTVLEEGQSETPDPEIMDRATANGWVVFTNDKDFLTVASRRIDDGEPFSGVVKWRSDRWLIGPAVADLELIAHIYQPDDMSNRIEFIPFQ
jgi:hypothetical protein